MFDVPYDPLARGPEPRRPRPLRLTESLRAARLGRRSLLPAARGPRPLRGLELATLELTYLHQGELGKLLRQAARLRALATPGARVVPSQPDPPPSLGAWRARARAFLSLCAHEGFQPPSLALLRRLARERWARWPDAVELARLAVDVSDGETARLTLGYAHLGAGDGAEAARVFRELLHRGTLLRSRWRVFEGLAAAHEALGRRRLALGAIELAAEHPGCGIDPLVRGLVLALLVGDSRRARLAAARLDILVDPEGALFRASLARLRARRAHDPERHRLPQPELANSLFGDEPRASSPAALVCRTLR